jgi:menaquinone-dependent protoporphyrinogen oxidase
MSEKILVTYATKYGSTTGVADSIASILREKSNQVDVMPVREVKSLAGYQAVVLGSPLYIGSILGDASKFLVRHQAGLMKIPYSFFVLGPLENTPEEQKSGREQLDNVLKKLEWFKPASAESFVGAYDSTKLRFPDSLINLFPANPLKGRPATDNRNWDDIHAWAESLPSAMHLQTA